jgi:hypothetical protein
MITRSKTWQHGSLPTALFVVLTVIFWATVAVMPVRAAGPDEASLNSAALSELQERASHAQLRDQCFLYTQLVHELTDLAGRQMTAGQDELAAATMLQVDAAAAKVQQASSADAKRLKNAEKLLDDTTHHLADMVRVASDQQRAAMQATLRHLNAVHSNVLALVFAR